MSCTDRCLTMATKVYVDTIGTAVYLNVCEDISNATGALIKVKKPDETVVDWDASIIEVDGETKYLRHVIKEDEIDIPGVYELQAYVLIGSWRGRGTTDRLVVYENFT